MRLIDANLLRNKTVWADRHTASGNVCKLVVEVEDIEKLPNIDAVPVIRCKDCKYWNKHHFVDIYVCSIHNKEGQYPYLLFEMTADEFCSRGEKR